MVKKPGIGIVGTGRIANSHMRSMQEHEPSRVNAVMDVVPDKANDFAETYGLLHVSTDLNDLLANEEVDAVILSTLPFAHLQPALDALAAGKHVLCEQPFSMLPFEAERMAESGRAVNLG